MLLKVLIKYTILFSTRLYFTGGGLGAEPTAAGGKWRSPHPAFGQILAFLAKITLFGDHFWLNSSKDCSAII